MKGYVQFKTKKGNSYLFNCDKKSYILLHPLMKYFIDNYLIGNHLKSLKEIPKKLSLNDEYIFEEKEIEYYYQKLIFLIDSGYFEETSQKGQFGFELSQSVINERIANISNVVFEVTDACNLNCTYCGYGDIYNDYDPRENTYLRIEEIIKVFEYLIPYWKSYQNKSKRRNVKIGFYGGEPLLNIQTIKQTVSYLEELKLEKCSFSYNMTTNGVLLSKYLDFLVANDFSLLLSLDGNKKNHGYRIDHKGINSFDTVIRNIRFVQSKYPEYFEKKVRFNAVLHNKNSAKQIQEFIYDQFRKTPQISTLNNMGIKEEKKDLFESIFNSGNEELQDADLREKLSMERFIEDANFFSLTKFINWFNDNVFKNCLHLLSSRIKKQIPTGTCLPFDKKMYITTNLKILPCERIGHQYNIGEIKDKVEIDVNKVAKTYSGYFKRILRQCEQCYQAQNCPKCVFNLESILDTPIICNAFSNEKRFSNNLATEISLLESYPEAYEKVIANVILK